MAAVNCEGLFFQHYHAFSSETGAKGEGKVGVRRR